MKIKFPIIYLMRQITGGSKQTDAPLFRAGAFVRGP
jgi:hypothetical protein